MVHTYTRTQEVQAIQYNGNNLQEIKDFVGEENIVIYDEFIYIDNPSSDYMESLNIKGYVVKSNNSIFTMSKDDFEDTFKLIN